MLRNDVYQSGTLIMRTKRLYLFIKNIVPLTISREK